VFRRTQRFLPSKARRFLESRVSRNHLSCSFLCSNHSIVRLPSRRPRRLRAMFLCYPGSLSGGFRHIPWMTRAFPSCDVKVNNCSSSPVMLVSNAFDRICSISLAPVGVDIDVRFQFYSIGSGNLLGITHESCCKSILTDKTHRLRARAVPQFPDEGDSDKQ
jgi:hypothetical protein